MSVSLVEVMVAASQRLAPLSGECAGHAVLAAADQLLTNPRLVGAADVMIEESGSVRLGHAEAADARGCDEALRALLGDLLTVAHSGGAGLLRVGRSAATGDLAQLVKELEVALIPANRAAARRSLARLYRETSRARAAGSLSALPPPVLARRAPPAPVLLDPALPEPAAPAPACEPLAVTEVRWATAPYALAPLVPEPPPRPDVELAIEVEVEFEATPTPAMVIRTQPLPKVAPRQELHETAPLPLVSPKPLCAEHETPLEPVLSRRHAGPPRVRREFPDIHETPYLGTLVSTVPVYDESKRAAWQVPEQAPPAASPPAEWELDESTTDPAPVVAWSNSDDGGARPLAAEASLAPPEAKERRVFRPSDVEELVERFRIADPDPDPHLARGLKQLAGITATPPPVLARSDAASRGPVPKTPPELGEAGSALRPIPTVRIVGS